MPLNEPASDAVATGSLVRPVLLFAIALATFICPSYIATSDTVMTVGLDWQVMIKLCVSGFISCIGVWGFLTTPMVRRMILSAPVCCIVVILMLALPSAITGGSLSALPCIVINFAFLVFVATCLYHLNVDGFMAGMVVGTLLVCASAWFLYLLVPKYGVFLEPLADGLSVSRLGGMAHPNSVGRTAGIGLIALVSMLHQGRIKKNLALIAGAILFGTLVWTVSRTAMAACVVGMLVMFIDQIRSRYGLNLIAAGAVAAMLGVFMLGMVGKEDRLVEKVVGSISKSGDASELTTGTGRVGIWTESIRLISEQPITGYGFGAAPTLLIDFSQSTHNMYLHAALVGGVAAGAMMVMTGLWLLNVCIAGQYRVVRALAIFLLISGLFEETVLETFPGPATLAWLICCLHPLRLPKETPDLPSEPDRLPPVVGSV